MYTKCITVGHECVYCWIYYHHPTIMLHVCLQCEIKKPLYLLFFLAFLKKMLIRLFLGVWQNIINSLTKTAPSCEKQKMEVWRISYRSPVEEAVWSASCNSLQYLKATVSQTFGGKTVRRCKFLQAEDGMIPWTSRQAFVSLILPPNLLT